MPRDGNGVYSKPAGIDASPDTTIESADWNAFTADMEQDANTARPIVAGGTGATTAVGASDKLSTQGSNIASATTTNLALATGVAVTITGTTTITGFGTVAAGVRRLLTFAGVLILTHNASSLILPGGANITTAAGDTAELLSLGSGNWRVVRYTRADGRAVLTEVSLNGAETLANKTLTSPILNTPTINNATFTGIDPWAFQPIGVPIPVQSNITGVTAPPTNQAYRYILLTAGETGSGKYNNGVLGSESVTGSAPLVQATATVTLSGSPVNGQSVRLINTERRFLRAGSTGTVENDQMQQITGEIRSGMHAAAAIAMFTTPSGAISNIAGINNAYPSPASTSVIADGISFDSANSPNARTGTETRAKNIGVEYYMRIK
jgi:hypothetical protein